MLRQGSAQAAGNYHMYRGLEFRFVQHQLSPAAVVKPPATVSCFDCFVQVQDTILLWHEWQHNLIATRHRRSLQTGSRKQNVLLYCVGVSCILYILWTLPCKQTTVCGMLTTTSWLCLVTCKSCSYAAVAVVGWPCKVHPANYCWDHSCSQ